MKLAFFIILLFSAFSTGEKENYEEGLLQLKRELDLRAQILRKQEDVLMERERKQEEAFLKREKRVKISEQRLYERETEFQARIESLNQIETNLYDWEQRLTVAEGKIDGKFINPNDVCEREKLKEKLKTVSKILGPLKLDLKESSIKVFRNMETNKFSWEDSNDLISKKEKEKIEASLQSNGKAMSNGLFDSISTSFRDVPVEARPFFRELMVPISEYVDLERRDLYKRTPLCLAATFNAGKAVAKLIDRGAKIEAQDGFGGTALHWAAWEGSDSACKLLLQKRAEINVQDQHGWTPLIFAAAFGHVDIVKLLLESDADTKITNDRGMLLTDLAIRDCADIIRAHESLKE